MKFYCDSCNAKYLIGDEKVEGKVLRIRCKRCSHVIEVRGPAQLPAEAASPSSSPSAEVEWFYSRAGETFGPFPLAVLQERFSSGQLGDEAYVWHAALGGWVPAKDQDEFRAFFDQGLVRKPARPTMNLRSDDLRAALEEARLAKEAKEAASSPRAAAPYSAGRASGNPSHILKRASAAHEEASGSAILSRPAPSEAKPAVQQPGPGGSLPRAGVLKAAAVTPKAAVAPKAAIAPKAAAATPKSEPAPASPSPAAAAPQGGLGRGTLAGAAVDPGERLRALRERLGARGPGGAAAPGAPTPTSAGAPGLASRIPTGATSLRERLAQRSSSSQLPAVQPRPATPAKPDPATVEAEIPAVTLALSRGPAEPDMTVEADLPALAELMSLASPSLQRPAPEPAPEPQEPEIEETPEALSFEEPEAEELEVEEPEALSFEEPPVEELTTEGPSFAIPELASLAAEVPAPAPEPAPAPPIPLDIAPAPRDLGSMMPLPAGSSAAQADDGEMSRSLVLQLGELKQRNRRLRLVAGIGAAAVLFVLAISAAVYVLYFAGPSEQSKALAEEARLARERQTQTAEVGKADLAHQKGYSPEKLAELGEVIELGEEQMVFDPSEVDPMEAPEGEKPSSAAAVAPPVAAGAEGKTPDRAPGLKIPSGLLSKDKGTSLDEALGSSRNAEGDSEGIKRRADVAESTGQVAKVEAPASSGLPGLKGDSGRSIFQDVAASRPQVKVETVDPRREDSGAAPSLPATLGKEALVAGFRNVRRSADQCMERHAKRSGALPKGKVKVVVTIENNGAVSAVEMDPEIANTVFESCMRSHTGRWRFPQFGGEALHVARVFLLQ